MLQGPQYTAGPLSVRDAIMAYQDEREGKGGKLGGPTGCTGCGDLSQNIRKWKVMSESHAESIIFESYVKINEF